ncbi:MAG: DUF4943 domain-containing protein [Bacteroidetes bacterium]|nr:DUF4943 domain-containing protein [Bacteroidota bacterium]
MKNLLFCFLGFVILSSSTCDKKDEIPDTTIGIFIQNLMDNNLDGHFCIPGFDSDDIQELLEYRNDKTKISQYYSNPISSFRAPEVSLGIYTLWIVEAIRIHEAGEGKECLDFPSLNPRFGFRNLAMSSLPDQETAQNEVAKSYFLWWSSLNDQPFENYRNIDPMENTQYRWF